MRKNILIIAVFAILFIAVFTNCVYATDENAINSADVLYKLGLFKGTGENEDGSPIYSLNQKLNRQEAITLFIRLLGKEEDAISSKREMPFKDVDDWAKPFVAYAYEHGFTVGVAEDRFGSHDPVTANQYLTFLLSALGYERNKDFQWDKSVNFAEKIGFNPINCSGAVERSNAVLWNCNALVLPKKGGKETLSGGTFEGKPKEAEFIAANKGFIFIWNEDNKAVVAHYDTDFNLTDRYEIDTAVSKYKYDAVPKSYKLKAYDSYGRNFGYYYGLCGLYKMNEDRFIKLSSRPVLDMTFLRYGAGSSDPVVLTADLNNLIYHESTGLFSGDTIIEIKKDGTEDLFLSGNIAHGIKITKLGGNGSTVEFEGIEKVEENYYSTYTYALFREYDEENEKFNPSMLVTKYEEGNPNIKQDKRERAKWYKEQKRLYDMGIGSEPGPEVE